MSDGQELMAAWERLHAERGEGQWQHHPELFRLLARVYRCRPVPQVLQTPTGPCGVPAFEIRRSVFGRKITSMPFNFYPPLLGDVDERAAVQRLVDMARDRGPSWYVEYKTFTPGLEEGSPVPLVGIRPSLVSSVHLANDSDEQRRGYAKNHRQRLRTAANHARREGVKVGPARSLEDVARFYRLLVALYRDKHRMIPQPYGLYAGLYSLTGAQGGCDILLARRGAEVLAGIVVLKGPRSREYCWGATGPHAAKKNYGALLVDRAVSDAVAAGAREFGFGSSSPTDKDLLFYKERWGCTHRPINYYYWNKEPRPVDLEHSFRLVRKVFPLVPGAVLRAVSRFAVPWLC